MKINSNNVYIAEMQTENIDDELIVYNQEEKKIVVFNKTASIVWKKIINSSDMNVDITTESITKTIMEVYQIHTLEEKNIYEDVQNIINQFFSEKLISNIK